MPKEAVFTMKLEPELRDQFMAAAEAAHRPASQLVRELMREFILRQRQTREYDEFLQHKVEAARTSMRAGRGRSKVEVLMPKEAVFTMKLEPELRDQFMAAAEAAHRPASQLVRELMREFILRQRQTREYDEFLQHKVEAARTSMRAGRGRSNDAVEAKFAARRTKATGQA